MTLLEIVLQWLLLGLVTVVVAFRGQLTIFHPVTYYLAFHFVVFVLRPTLIFAGDLDKVWTYMEFFPDHNELSLTLQVTSACLITFVFVFSFLCPSRRIFDLPRFTDLAPGEKRAMWLMMCLLTPLGLYSVFGASMGGRMTEGGVFVMTGSSGYLNDAQRVLIPICILFAWSLRWRLVSLIPLVGFLGYRFTEGWGRWTILLTMVAVFLVYMWDKRRIWFSGRELVAVAVIGCLLAVGFHQLGKNRNAGKEWMRSVLEDTTIEKAFERNTAVVRFTEDEINDPDLLNNIDGLDFANFDFLTYVVAKVPEETEKYAYGVQHLQLFTEPIPRAIWEGKPVGAPVPYFNLNDYGNFIGLTVSIIGDGWISAGFFGALLNMVFAAAVLAFVYHIFLRNQTSPYIVFPYLIFTAMLIQFFRDGSIVSMMKFLLFTIILPFSLWWFLANVVFVTREQRPIDLADDEEDAGYDLPSPQDASTAEPQGELVR
ncbi:MAG: O-antigen polymerase [Opitutales bacterium]